MADRGGGAARERQRQVPRCAALALADEQSLLPVCPRFVASDPPMLVLPGDPEHEVRDQRVAGPTRFVLRDGKFLSDDPRGTHEPR